MKRRICSLALALVMVISAVAVCCIAVSATTTETLTATDTEFMINDTGLNITSFLSGNKDDGYHFKVNGVGRVQLVTAEQYPIAKSTFDIQLRYNGNSYGFFGISKNREILEDPRATDNNNLNFVCQFANGGQSLIISILSAEKQLIQIANIRPVGSDAFWNPSVVNFSFVKKGEHWYLAANGVVCNNIEANFEYAKLDSYFGSEFFDNVENAYFRFGINTITADKNEIYFKSLTNYKNDWQSTAVNTYAFTHANIVREYRGQGITAETLFSKIPSDAVGSREEGHVIDFTDTDGYAQTANGFDLKITTFEVAPIVAGDNKNNIWYYLGFTANPSALKDHSQKPNETIEFNLASVYGNNYTGGWVITNTNDTAAKPTKIDLGRTGYWRTHRTEETYKTQPMLIKFVQEKGPDNQLHWYMQTKVSGTSVTVKSTNVASDVYLRFDDIIDRKVYFRMGTCEKVGYDFKMYCKVNDWIDDSALDALTPEEKSAIAEIDTNIKNIGEINADNYKEKEIELQNIRNAFESLSPAAKEFVAIQEIVAKEKEVTALKALYECGDWYAKDGLTTYTGDKWLNYTFSNALDAGQQVVVTSSGNYDITKNSFYWKGINVPGGTWFLFGLNNDMQSTLLPNNFDNGINFILTPSANALIIQFWDATQKKAVHIGEADLSRYDSFEYYNKTKSHLFTFVKEDGHWYLKIDDIVFNGQYFEAIDNYLEQYGTETKIRFAGHAGLGECVVNVIDPTVDDSIVPEDIVEDVKKFDDKVNELGGISAITETSKLLIKDKLTLLLAEYDSFDSRIKKYITTKTVIDDMLLRIELMDEAQNLGEWNTSMIDLTYVKNENKSYDFSSVYGKGFGYATTTKPYDFEKMGFDWTGVKISNGWFTFGLTSDYRLSPTEGNTKQSLTFILTPRNSDIIVQYWDGDKRQAVMLAELTNAVYSGFSLFDFERTHTYGMVKKGNHWYLYIDDQLFDGKCYDSIDTFMEMYGKSAYVTFGAYTGFDACNVMIRESEYSDGSVIIDSGNIKGTLSDFQKYLQLLEENYVSIWEYDESSTIKLFKMWNSLDYRSKLEVEAVLLDDEFMWEIHDIVITYAPELYDGIIPSNKNEENITGSSEKEESNQLDDEISFDSPYLEDYVSQLDKETSTNSEIQEENITQPDENKPINLPGQKEEDFDEDKNGDNSSNTFIYVMVITIAIVLIIVIVLFIIIRKRLYTNVERHKK